MWIKGFLPYPNAAVTTGKATGKTPATTAAGGTAAKRTNLQGLLGPRP
jgi:hypothetical protein